MTDVIIPNEKEFNEKLKRLILGGKDNLHVISDFDATLSKSLSSNEKSNTTFGKIQNSGLLGESFERKSKELKDYYQPIEHSIGLAKEEKAVKMREWTVKAWNLIVESKLNRSLIDEINENQKIEMRLGALDFVTDVTSIDIPLLIYSGGIKEIIDGALKEEASMEVLSNYFLFDDQGEINGWIPKLIDSSAKTGDYIKQFSHFEKIKEKDHVIVMGDLVEDLRVLEGLDHQVELKIGFLNRNVEENLDIFKEKFDVVIINDGPMTFVNEMIKQIIETS
jgi:cytosolic 5'-nucleotidase 3